VNTREDANLNWLPITSARGTYRPRVNDLVVALPRSLRAGKANIPSSFMQSEAVDSSLLIGHGASFTVTRQAIPCERSAVIDSLSLGKFVALNMPVRLQKRPKYVVYKSPRITFRPDGEPIPEDRGALESVLTEIHALLHPPLLHHANIINILGVAWGSNHANPFQHLPVLVVEYGDRGTLADVQINNDPLSEHLKSQIALGIANGLQALHDEDIVHGDLKPDNIIMCSDEEKILIPKLADFGFAIIEAVGTPDIKLAGTRTWRAPESHSRLPVSTLRLTDIYSFGLVIWSIALDGRSPFSIFVPETIELEERYVAQDRLKSEDRLRGLSRFEEWVPRWQDSVSAANRKSLGLRGNSYTSDTGLDEQCSPFSRRCDDNSTSATCTSFRERVFFCTLEEILDRTLSILPSERDLPKAIMLCEQGMAADLTP
jgi:serine/threonine protein kinase